MLPRLLALGDDVDAAILLQLHREQGGIALGARKLLALRFPGRPQRIRLGEPFRLRKRACDGGWKQHESLPESFGLIDLSACLPRLMLEVQDNKSLCDGE